MAFVYNTSTQSESGAGKWLLLDCPRNREDFSILVEISGNMTIDVEFTIEKEVSAGTPILHDVLNRITESCASTLYVPMTGIRINVVEYGVGSATLHVLQGHTD